MKRYSTVPCLLTTLALSGILTTTATAAPPTVAPPKAIPTAKPVTPASIPVVPTQSSTAIFRCVQNGAGYATIVSNNVKQATLITWNSNAFGSEYTPQSRCNAVTQRFQTIVAKNGGQLKNLMLTIGTVNQQTVVCAINQGQYGCNTDNLLFTLKPENARNPGTVLATLLQVGKYGSGNAVSETDELPEFNLEEVVNQKLSNGSEEVEAPQPSTPTAPDTSGQSGF